VKPKKLVIVRFRSDRNKWECDYRLPTATGSKRCRPLFDDEAAATAHAAGITKNLNDGLPIIAAGKDVLLRDYAVTWLQARQGIVAARTLRCYNQCLHSYVLPRLGHMRVRDIKVAHLLPWLTHLKSRGFSPNTLRLGRASLSALLGYATLEGICDDNVMAYLSKQKTSQPGKLTKSDQQESVRPFETQDELDRFLAVARQPRYQPYGATWTVMAGAGLRPGEAFALKPGDIDLHAKTLRIERALDHDRISTKSTKTHETRIVRLSTSLTESLRRHLIWLKEQTLRHGWGEAHWLFPSPQNEPLKEAYGTKLFHRCCREAGVVDHVPYDMRHSYASHMFSAGANPGFISRQLGHRNSAITLKVYARWLPNDEADRRQADLLEPDPGTTTLSSRVSPESHDAIAVLYS